MYVCVSFCVYDREDGYWNEHDQIFSIIKRYLDVAQRILVDVLALPLLEASV